MNSSQKNYVDVSIPRQGEIRKSHVERLRVTLKVLKPSFLPLVVQDIH